MLLVSEGFTIICRSAYKPLGSQLDWSGGWRLLGARAYGTSVSQAEKRKSTRCDDGKPSNDYIWNF